MESDTITWLILLSGIIYSIAMYAYRKYKSGETFDKNKFATTVGYGAMLAISAYLATGVLPESTAIITQLEAGLPDAPEIMTLGFTLLFGLAHQFFKTSSSDTTETPAATGTATAAAATTVVEKVVEKEKWSVGFTVTPTFSRGLSPLTANLQAVVGMNSDAKTRAVLTVDWQDGSEPETAKVDTKTGIASLSHAFTFNKGDGKYTGHSFYPKFTVTQTDGTIQEFNTETTGRCCEIEVQSQ